ncbi:Zinc finger and SCAN domain-containing [Argiope bruennichi]|uniref:Zinc finger and SCAN domain-containing n=1 Tax=Argiope bruennichi TaxID=94029 RepID=A0A8T0FBD8_ARGBR|nr:Zinc finger and SCAN domain-containing [Argiope bruennichi]
MDVIEYVIRNALSDNNNNVSGTANSTENPDLPPGDNEPKNCKMQVSECVNDDHISPEVPSQVHSKKTKVTTYVKELHSTKKDDNAVAGPSGVCPHKKKFPKTCCRKDTLKPNYQTHTGKEPFMCNICKKKFPRNQISSDITECTLAKNLMNAEYAEKKFSWKSYLITIIDYILAKSLMSVNFVIKFCSKNNLKMHVMTHTGERPYKCPACEMSFINSSNCKKHHKESTSDTN